MATPNGSSNNLTVTTNTKVNNFLPDDVIEQILVRLPSKSLVRFTLVHKRWLYLISDPKFIQSHLKHVLSDHDQVHNLHRKLMLLLSQSSQLGSINYESPDDNEVAKFNVPVPCRRISVLGSCNGLFLLGIHKEFNDLAIIWNPLFKNYKEVTDFKYRNYLHSNRPIGFGYDPLTNDYKVVSLDVYKALKGRVGDMRFFNVFTLKTNSSRSFELKPLAFSQCRWGNHFGTFYKASLYWIVDAFHSNKLIRFDLKYENFSFVQAPASDRDILLIDYTHLVVARGCLYIFKEDYRNCCFNLLMMKEDENDIISWTKGVNIRLPCGLLYVLRQIISLTPNGEILMRVEYGASLLATIGLNGNASYTKSAYFQQYEVFSKQRELHYGLDKLISYNPDEGAIRIIEPHGAEDWYKGITYQEKLGVPYVETLVSPS